MSKIVSLDKYRSENAKVFSGEQRGKLVAKSIKDEYGENIQIKVPDDVLYINSHFRVGFNKILPTVKIPKA